MSVETFIISNRLRRLRFWNASENHQIPVEKGSCTGGCVLVIPLLTVYD